MSRLLLERTLIIGVVIAAGVIYNYLWALNSGGSVEHARTVAVTTMVFFQFFQAWNSRSEHESVFRMNPLGNKFLFYSMIAAALAQLAFIFARAFAVGLQDRGRFDGGFWAYCRCGVSR
jgi:Ca2+-transporting ATPase